MASQKISLKLLLDKKGQRVLFAEANKEFVDFLFHVFSLPIGTLVELLGSKQMVGCLGELKESIVNFNETYLQPGLKKDDIVNPKTPFSKNTFLFGNDSCSPITSHRTCAPKQIYRCSTASKHFYARGKKDSCCWVNASLHSGTICPNCKGLMNAKMTRIMHKKEKLKLKAHAMKKKKQGFVHDVMTYMVMDDLVVKPMSAISSITTFIRKFGVKDLSQLEEKVVSFEKVEGLKLLKASLKTKKVLTSIYIHKIV